MILEIDRAELREYYKGNIKRAIAEKGGLLWTPERIKHAFNFGNGTEKDLKRYMKDNNIYCIFVEI